MKISTLIILIAIVAIGGVAFIFLPTKIQKEPIVYKSEELDIQFSYPDKYFIAYESSSTGERNQHVIVITKDTPKNRELFSNPKSATEGPPAITIVLFQNDLDKYTAKTFIENTSFSNFKLSDGNVTEVIIGGESGLQYRSTGLYENENVIVARPDYVYMFTSFYNSPTDSILNDFEEILGSVEFISKTTPSENTPTSADNAPPGSMHNLPVPDAVAAVRTQVADDLGIDEGVVIIMSAFEKDWPNSCLGLTEKDETCLQVITPGYEVTVQAKGDQLIYHTNKDGSLIRQQN